MKITLDFKNVVGEDVDIDIDNDRDAMLLSVYKNKVIKHFTHGDSMLFMGMATDFLNNHELIQKIIKTYYIRLLESSPRLDQE